MLNLEALDLQMKEVLKQEEGVTSGPWQAKTHGEDAWAIEIVSPVGSDLLHPHVSGSIAYEEFYDNEPPEFLITLRDFTFMAAARDGWPASAQAVLKLTAWVRKAEELLSFFERIHSYLENHGDCKKCQETRALLAELQKFGK